MDDQEYRLIQERKSLRDANLKLRRGIEDRDRLLEDRQSSTRDQFAVEIMRAMISVTPNFVKSNTGDVREMVRKSQDTAELLMKEGRRRDAQRLTKLRDKEENESRRFICTNCNCVDSFSNSLLDLICKHCGHIDYFESYPQRYQKTEPVTQLDWAIIPEYTPERSEQANLLIPGGTIHNLNA